MTVQSLDDLSPKTIAWHRELLKDKTDRQGDCWLWTGSTVDGYGTSTLQNRRMRVHRISYLLHKGNIPTGMAVRHTCGNRACANPEHLILKSRCGNKQSPAFRNGMQRASLEERFWAKVKRTPGCWLWTGVTVGGYGRIRDGNMMASAHRVSWRLHRGVIPAGKCVCHNCPGGDNPRCVRPEHLFLGTQKENMRHWHGLFTPAASGA